jgi:HSP20 family molecular chaperone IbpA
MAFSRSRSFSTNYLLSFASLNTTANASRPLRVGARFVPVAACSTAHIGRRLNLWNHEGVNPLINQFRWGWGWDPAHWNTAGGGHPAIDLVEKADEYVIEADLPGVKKGELNVRVGDEGWSLIVEGRRNTATSSTDKVEGEGERDNYLYMPI